MRYSKLLPLGLALIFLASCALPTSTNLPFAVPPPVATATATLTPVPLAYADAYPVGAPLPVQPVPLLLTPVVGSPTITVDASQQLQTMRGFGAALTDSSAYVISQLPAAQRDQLMTQLFSPTEGIGISVLRIPLGSSDFTATPPSAPAPYSYDDLPPGHTDPTLTHFSIAHDTAYILPLLRQARQLNPQLRVLAATWSPPAWMKTNDSMVDGALRSDMYSVFAQYLVKALVAYEQAGVPIDMLTPQNEPGQVGHGFSSLAMSGAQEAAFIADDLGPALAAAPLAHPPQLYALDYSWWSADSVLPPILADAQARQYLAGIAWHCYSGDPTVMAQTLARYPNLDQIESECSTGPTGLVPQGAFAIFYESVANGASTALTWNLALNPAGGPKMGTGCSGCTGLVSVTPQGYTFTGELQQLDAFSQHIQPGAVRVATHAAPGLQTLAFRNRDGSTVLLVRNTALVPFALTVQATPQLGFQDTLVAGGITAYTWHN